MQRPIEGIKSTIQDQKQEHRYLLQPARWAIPTSWLKKPWYREVPFLIIPYVLEVSPSQQPALAEP